MRRLAQVIALVNGGVQLVVLLTTVTLCLCFATPFAAFFTASLLTPGTFLISIPVNLRLRASPRFTLWMARAWPYRRACSWRLRRLARELGQHDSLGWPVPDPFRNAPPASTAFFAHEERVNPGPDDHVTG